MDKQIYKDTKYALIFISLFILIFGTWFYGPNIKKLFMDSEVKPYDFETENVEHYDIDSGRYTETYIIHYYRVNGTKYKYRCQELRSSFSISLSDLTIYYDSKNPSNCVSSIELEMSFLEIFVTILLLSLFLFFGKVFLKSKKNMNKTKNFDES